MPNSEVSRKLPVPRAKIPAPLSENLNRRLANYAMAAAAAGVATLACSAPAEGEPVCKNISIQLSNTTTFALNPANQVAPPFNVAQTTFSSFPSSGYYYFWWNRGFFTPNSAGANVLVDDTGLVADAASGELIGPDGKFGKGQSYGMMFTYGNGTFVSRAHGTLKQHRGNLSLRQVNYVGFEFLQAGKIHYGWARLQVRFVRSENYMTKAHIHILGYGYETAPNTAIAAGSCGATTASNAGSKLENNGAAENIAGSNVSPRATLGMLAGGSAGLALWRRNPEDTPPALTK